MRMYEFHRTPFEKIVDNILDQLLRYDARFTFPTVASVAPQKPEVLGKIIGAGCEVAVHGYRHLKYSLLSPADQKRDLAAALSIYRQMNVQVSGFRAPYNAYGKDTPEILNDVGLLWDGGIGYSRQYNEGTEMFRVPLAGGQSNFVCIPLSRWSDDLMIDEYHYGVAQMVAVMKRELDKARSSGSMVMFDLHPIRMGQPQYAGALGEIVSYGKGIGGWFPTVSEAVRFRQGREDWGDHEFCCLLTGDIDNFYFLDYLRRLA